MWKHWITMILGIWVALIPFLRFGDSESFTIILMVSGSIIALTSAWSIVTESEKLESYESELRDSALW